MPLRWPILLVGNDKMKRFIEIHFPGPQILFEQNTLIAITGADYSLRWWTRSFPAAARVVRKNTSAFSFAGAGWAVLF